MAMCKLCDVNPPAPNGICEPCMEKLGIIEMPPPRRRATPCVKCHGLRFVRVIPREHTVRAMQDTNAPEIAPMTLTQKPNVEPKLWGEGTNIKPPSVVLGDGMLETYTCLQCGYVEWYVEDPSEIPIGPELMSDIVDYTPDKPYR